MSEKIEVIAELKDLISGKFKEINAQIDNMDNKLSNINQGSGKGGIMGSVLGANLLTGAITKAAGAAVEFGKESFQAFGRAEQFQTALTTLLYGNEQMAGALNNQLKQFAMETPFELSEVQQATRLMIAYGSSAGNVVGEMRMLGDVASGTAQPLGEIAYLYGTVRQQQKANLIDLKQFANRGIPIFKELAKVTKYTLEQLVEGGKDVDITFSDVEKAFKNMTAEGSQFGGMMDKQSKTLLGQTSNLSDAWEQLHVSIGASQQGILKDTIKWTTDMVNGLRQVVDRSNYIDKSLGSLQGNYGIGTFDNDAKDNRYVVQMKDGTKKSFTDPKEARKFQKENEANVAGNTMHNTHTGFQAFSEDIRTRVAKLKPEDTQNMLNEITDLKRNILNDAKSGKMSNSLAINELAVLSQATKDTMGIRMLDKDKKGADAKAKSDAEKKPKDLETVAKANRAMQTIVNIENLVRELTNNVGTPEEAKKLTAVDVAKILIGAVNDLHVIGQ